MAEGNNNLPQCSFNLVDEPWIPVVGEAEKRSLMGIFTAPAPAGLSGNAVDKIVILRLLLSIVQASVKIPDEEAYQNLSEEKIAENARKYLDEHRHLFDIYDKEKPFLQFPQLAEKGEVDSCSSLSVCVATGNKTVLTRWNCEQPLPHAEKAVLLLRSTCFACGGKKYDSSLVLSPGYVKGKTGKGGTLLGSYGYLHSYLVGTDLWQTIYWNLLTEEDIKSIGVFSSGTGLPAWEKMPAGEMDARAEEYKNSYQGNLLPLDKFILLADGGLIKTDGISYVANSNAVSDPAITTFLSGNVMKFLWTRTEKRPWRELSALLGFVKIQKEKGSVPPYFLSFGLQKKHKTDWLSFWVGGVAVSSNSGEQYLSGTDDYVESEFHVYTPYLGYQQMETYEDMMHQVENTSKWLSDAVAAYFKIMNDDSGSEWASRAKEKFWEKMEAEHHSDKILGLSFSAGATEEARREEVETWRELVFGIYDEFCPNETARQIEAWAKANPRYSKKSEDKKTKTKKK